jgi:DNA invertase Pin-like site-specific DNA recombinase
MKTAIYLRQSLDRDLNKVGIDYQRESLLKLCATKGWDEPVEYVDRNVSATTGRREAYEDLCEDIRNGVIGKLAVWDMDRLHRQPRELEDFIDLAEKHGVELANVGGDVDLSTPSGRMFARMKGTVAKYEVEQKSARQKAANEERAKDGRAWVERVFGYHGNEVVEDEAEAIRQGCRDLLNGASLYGIATQWNEAGIKTVKDRTWNGSTVRQVLIRARNAGLQTYHGNIMEGVETAWPAIVTRDTYDAVCAMLADPKRHSGKRRARAHLLSGLAICGLCGRKMGTTTRSTKTGAKRIVYQCKNTGCMKIVRDLVRTDELVVDIVTRRLGRPDAAKVFAKPTVDTKALNAEASTYRALIAAANAEYDEGIIDGRRLQGRIDKLQPKLDAVEAKLLGANTSRKLDGLLGNPKAAEAFAALSLDRRRAVIDAVCVVAIEPNERPGGVFDPQRIRIDWR